MSIRSISVAVFAFGALAVSAAPVADGPERHEFTFARLSYPNCSGSFEMAYKSWSTDFPKADEQLIMGVRRLTVLDAYPGAHPLILGHEDLNRYPFVYAVEASYLCLDEDSALQLRRYLKAGGFLMVDDFWGTAEWDRFASEMQKVLPDTPIQRLDLEHPLFSTVFDIREIVQVPNSGQGIQGGPTFEADGYIPEVFGISDEHGRLMVLIMHNTDLGDAWEYAENPYYPVTYSTYAYQIAVNAIIYAMSH